MITTSKRNSFKIVSLIIVFCVLICVCNFGKDLKVNALSEEVFEMTDLYKLRLNGNGFAFTVKMNDAVKQTVNDNLYFIIAPKTYFSKCDVNGKSYKWLLQNHKEAVLYVKSADIYRKEGDEDFWYANAGISNVFTDHIRTEYAAVAVIENANGYKIADGLSVNSLYNVVISGVYSGDYYSEITEYYGEWLGNTEYPFPIDSTTDYQAIKTLINTQDGFAFFKGKTIEIDESVNASDNALSAFYDNLITTHTVKWINYDGTLIEKDTHVKTGEMPVFDGETPQRVSDGDNNYKFFGWNKEISPVYFSVEYKAIYRKKPLGGDETADGRTPVNPISDGGGFSW